MRTCLSFAFSLCLAMSLSALYGQGNCTLHNTAGDYAFAFTGTSAIVAQPPVAADGLHWNALFAPIAGVGIYSIKPDGSVPGKYWMVAGARNFGLTPIPMNGSITLNRDCTGTTESLFGGAILREQFVVTGNGREIRSVAVQTAAPTGNWHTTSYRIGSCGQRNVRGDYLFECKNLFPLPTPSPENPTIFGGAIHIRMKIAESGDYTGTVYGKVGPDNTPFDVNGRIVVNDDCTAEGTLAGAMLPAVSQARGVFFNNGKQGFWLPLAGLLPNGSTVNQPYGFCTITQLDNK